MTLLELPMVTAVKNVQHVSGDVREPGAVPPERESIERSAYGGGLAPLEQLNRRLATRARISGRWNDHRRSGRGV